MKRDGLIKLNNLKSLISCNEKWTKHHQLQGKWKFDLAKFNMTHLDNDIVALMIKHVVDIARYLGKILEMELNGTHLPIKSN